jgi:uncharacterized C2H2 Zn-finger protein
MRTLYIVIGVSFDCTGKRPTVARLVRSALEPLAVQGQVCAAGRRLGGQSTFGENLRQNPRCGWVCSSRRRYPVEVPRAAGYARPSPTHPAPKAKHTGLLLVLCSGGSVGPTLASQHLAHSLFGIEL